VFVRLDSTRLKVNKCHWRPALTCRINELNLAETKSMVEDFDKTLTNVGQKVSKTGEGGTAESRARSNILHGSILVEI
jgi:hypothetical protein